MLEDLRLRRRTDSEVAAELGVNANYLNFVFNSVLKQRRIRGKISEKREAEHKLVESRRQIRIREAKKVVNGSKTLEKAAKSANCSVRTIRRYVERVVPLIRAEAYE